MQSKLPGLPDMTRKNMEVPTTCLTLRLTMESTLEEVQKGIEQFSQIYLISRELSKKEKEHYHIYVEVPTDLLGAERRKFTKKLKEIFPKLTNGNKCIYTSVVENQEKCIQYTLKDGEWVSKNIDPEILAKCNVMSYKKYNPKEFMERLRELEYKYLIDKNIPLENFIENFYFLKMDYDQNFTKNDGYFEKIYYKKYPEKLMFKAKNIASRIKNDSIDYSKNVSTGYDDYKNY